MDLDYNKQFESYIVKKNTQEKRRLSLDVNNKFTSTPPPPPPKLLPKPNMQHRIIEQFPNVMPSLTPAPGMEEEHIRKFRKSTIERRNKFRTTNFKNNILSVAPSIVKKTKAVRKIRKTSLCHRNKCKATQIKKVNRVLKLEKEDIPVIKEHQKHTQAVGEEPGRKDRKTTTVRRSYCRKKAIKVIPENTTKTKRKYVRSLKYTKKAKALLSEKSKSVKIIKGIQEFKQSEPKVVEEITTIIEQFDSMTDNNKVITQAPLINKKFPRIKHSNINYYRVCNIGFAETSKGIVFKCFTTNCKFQSYDQSKFRSHLISFHDNFLTIACKKFCSYCNELFTSSSVLCELEHITKKHLEDVTVYTNSLELNKEDALTPIEDNMVQPTVIDIENISIEDNIELPSNVNEDISKAGDRFLPYVAIENTSTEINLKLPQEAEKILVQEVEHSMEVELESTETFSKINNHKSSESEILFDNISDDECSSSSTHQTIESKLMQELSDISSDEDSLFNDSLEMKDMFDFNSISSDESIKSYKTVSSKTARINKILNNPDIFVQKVNYDGINPQILDEIGSKNPELPEKKTEKSKLIKSCRVRTQVTDQVPTQVTEQVPTQVTEQVPTQVTKQVPTQVTKQVPTQVTEQVEVQLPAQVTKQVPTVLPVHSQIKLTVQRPIEMSPPIIMNKLNIQALQPWIAKRPNFKYEVSCMKMLQKNALFATYKCMGFTCSYYTSSERLFKGHLKLHQQNHLCDYPDTYLFCSYCPQTFEKIDKLMNHIQETHKHDKYQCSHCFYRSCEMQSCSVHLNLYHSNQHTRRVLECEIPNVPIDIDGLFEKLIENRLKYVAPLRCKVCNISIFLLAEYLEHMNDHVDSSPVLVQDLVHNEIKTLEMLFSMNHYGFFQCLYCLHGTDIQDDMRAHLANKHASEFSYVCKREADVQEKAVSPESIKSTQLIKLINKNMLLEKFMGDVRELENRDNWCKFNDKSALIGTPQSTIYNPSKTPNSNFIINQNSGIVITNVYSISSETHLSSL